MKILPVAKKKWTRRPCHAPLFAHIPWYKYHKVWELANGIFRQQQIPERTVFSLPDVVSGEIEHRDAVLSKEEQLAQRKICLCVSRGQGRLVVDF